MTAHDATLKQEAIRGAGARARGSGAGPAATGAAPAGGATGADMPAGSGGEGTEAPLLRDGSHAAFLMGYLDTLSQVERLHRLLLDVIKDEFERLGMLEINAVQALLLYNVGGNEVTAGELKTRGYYQGSNVSYNLKKLVEAGFMHHQRCMIDRRSVRVKLTARGLEVREHLAALFSRHAETLTGRQAITLEGFEAMNASLRRLERFWTDQIRYIY